MDRNPRKSESGGPHDGGSDPDDRRSDGGQVVLATASYDGTIRLWEAHSGVCWKVISMQDKVQVNKLAITPNKKYIAGACT